MNTDDFKNRLDNAVSSRPSRWMEKALRDEANEAWLDRSAEIALRILSTLQAKNMSQKELAAIIGVSPQQINKIVKGNVNLTLETISKLEAALDIQLMAVPGEPLEGSSKREDLVLPHLKSNSRLLYKNRVNTGKQGSMVKEVSGRSEQS
jgi:transcriptional regulator with XRE-family HTH domain